MFLNAPKPRKTPTKDQMFIYHQDDSIFIELNKDFSLRAVDLVRLFLEPKDIQPIPTNGPTPEHIVAMNDMYNPEDEIIAHPTIAGGASGAMGVFQLLPPKILNTKEKQPKDTNFFTTNIKPYPEE